MGKTKFMTLKDMTSIITEDNLDDELGFIISTKDTIKYVNNFSMRNAKLLDGFETLKAKIVFNITRNGMKRITINLSESQDDEERFDVGLHGVYLHDMDQFITTTNATLDIDSILVTLIDRGPETSSYLFDTITADVSKLSVFRNMRVLSVSVVKRPNDNDKILIFVDSSKELFHK